jgi:hypothetical protein
MNRDPNFLDVHAPIVAWITFDLIMLTKKMAVPRVDKWVGMYQLIKVQFGWLTSNFNRSLGR